MASRSVSDHPNWKHRPPPEHMGQLIEMVQTGQVTHAAGRIVLRKMLEHRKTYGLTLD